MSEEVASTARSTFSEVWARFDTGHGLNRDDLRELEVAVAGYLAAAFRAGEGAFCAALGETVEARGVIEWDRIDRVVVMAEI